MKKVIKLIIIGVSLIITVACSGPPDVIDTAIDKQKELDAAYEKATSEIANDAKAKTDADTKTKADADTKTKADDNLGDKSGETVSQMNAVRSAQNYLSIMAFSRSGLIEQLTFEGYPAKDAEYAVDKVNPDWLEQAAKSAQNYLAMMAFSRSGLIEQLIYDGFTKQQAEFGASEQIKESDDNLGDKSGETVSQKNAVRSAQNYLSMMAFSPSGLIEQLTFEGYPAKDAEYAVDKVNPDWLEQAAKSAQNYLSFQAFSRSDLIEQLIYDGFTKQQAEFGVSAVGY